MKPEISHHRYDDGVHRFEYTLHLKSRLKHRYIRIRDGHPIISANRQTPKMALDAFVAEHAAWIHQQLSKVARQPYDLTQSGVTIAWRGEHYPVHITSGDQDRIVFDGKGAHFILKGLPTHSGMLALFQSHCKLHTPEHILPRVKAWTVTMALHPTRVTFRRARTRWGSCSSRNTLSLNTALMMLPDELIDYIIVHELAHIRHKNHSRDFWGLVAQYLPEHKQYRKCLREYEPLLS